MLNDSKKLQNRPLILILLLRHTHVSGVQFRMHVHLQFYKPVVVFQRLSCNYNNKSISLSALNSGVDVRVVLSRNDFKWLTPSTPAVPNCYCSKGSAPYWSNPPFLIYDIRALWRSVLSARAPECHKLKNGGLGQYGKV